MKTRFNFPTRILFGPGVLADLPAELLALGCKRPLVVTEAGLLATGIPERVQAVLRDAGLESGLFSDVAPNPSDGQVEAGAEAFRAHGADGIAAVGGGSPMDAGKAIQLRIHHAEPLEKYDDLAGGDALITGPLPPLVAVPTTSGTGSEVSRSAVISVAAADRKVVIFSPRFMPSAAICDPELTYGLPPRITAETGMDALSHNLEAYLARGYHPMADAIALAGVAMVAGNLPKAVANGRDAAARAEMMMASTMGAVAFQKGLGVIHSLAHPLSSVSGLSHGLANAIMMPHALRFNAASVPERIVEIARALGADDHSPEGAAAAVEALLQRIGLPARLGQAGVQSAQIEQLVDKAMQDGCHGCNPRTCSASDMKALFEAAL
ncbi:MAG: iron-containing alcohol dehydrogenase [Deltaproteobacteria bacterium]|nr:iron-containing alcohol dehydrogenase [Deltaproteobacteria bacterium]